MTLQQLNNLNSIALSNELFNCCGSETWVNKMMPFFPVADKEILLQQAAKQWQLCSNQDWLGAFAQHPKIGDTESLKKKFASTTLWAADEQSGASHADTELLQQLGAANTLYEEKFGFIFIVCATGKSAAEMLQLLNSRFPNSREQEIINAAAEQQKITRIRLQKLLQ